jgi:hypothetical protein
MRPSGMKISVSSTRTAKINIRISGSTLRNSARGNRMKTPATGPYMDTIPPKTDQIITWKDRDISRVDGPTVRMM